ncbi:MAG: ATP-binding protein, partial [Verrucomicrobiota bacterium]
HSRVGPEWANSTFSIEWRKEEEIDAVALFPIHVESPYSGKGTYGLPQSIRLEWFDEEGRKFEAKSYTDPEVDRKRRGIPWRIPIEDVRASRLRVVVEEPWMRGDSQLWALSEVVVFSGSRNLAAGRAVTMDPGQRPFRSGEWFPQALTDGNNPLGPPVVPDPSPSNGFLCDHSEDSEERKWMQIDLGSSKEIDEIRLYPSRPTDIADLPGTGFPVRFRLELDDDPAFLHPIVVFREEKDDFPSPGDCPVVLPVERESGRYVRLTVTRLRPFVQGFSFSLAEMEVWSGNRNVAAGAKVSASDVFSHPNYPRWKPDYLVDGYSSRNRIISPDRWVEELNLRRQLEHDIEQLLEGKRVANERIAQGSMITGSGFLLLATVLGMAFLRSLQVRRRETERLREQIAQDLHDDVGSNLGGIALLADSLAEDPNLQNDLRDDLLEIRDVSASMSQSMRDIVWLIQDRERSLGSFVIRLQETARRMGGGWELTFAVSPRPLPQQRLSLQVRRHVFLAFKEVLHNVRKHAQASRVAIEIETDERGDRLSFQVKDDGCGFDPSLGFSGNGMANLKSRAKALQGSVDIRSAPGEGCLTRFVGVVKP